MTELQQALALEESIEHEGVVYKLGPISVEVMGAWEDWLAGETLDRMLRLVGRARGPDAENRAIESVAKLSAAGVFDFYEDASQNRMRTLAGQKKMTFFRIKQHHPLVEAKVVNDIVEQQWEKLYLAIRKQLAAQAALDPNADAPAQTGANSESDGEQSSPESATPTTSSPPTNESAG